MGLMFLDLPACSNAMKWPQERTQSAFVASLGCSKLKKLSTTCAAYPSIQSYERKASFGNRAFQRRARMPQGRPGLFNLKSVFNGFMDESDSWDGETWHNTVHETDMNDYRVVLLRDAKLDRVIECFIDREIEIEGKKYATLMPADTPVIIAGYLEVDGSRQLVPILEDEKIDTLFPTAAAVEGNAELEEDEEDEDEDEEDEEDGYINADGFELESLASDHHGWYQHQDGKDNSGPTIDGHIKLRTDELIDSTSYEDEGSDDGSSSQKKDDDESEKVQVLATFYHQNEKYVVAAPLEPVLIIGSPVELSEEDQKPDEVLGKEIGLLGLGLHSFDWAKDLGADYILPDREELERVTPKIEKQLETIWDTEEKERKVLLRLREKLIEQWSRSE
eukprot:765813-Hanusia_phi.AAC.2